MNSESTIPVSILSPYASIGARGVALIIDALILGALGVVFGHMVPMIGGLAVWFLYAPVLESSRLRATLGKHLMGLQVTDLDGKQISLKASLIRNVVKAVSVAFLFIVAFFTQKKQAVHDLLADTLVINGESNVAVTDAWVESAGAVFKRAQSTFKTQNANVAEQLEKLQSLYAQGALTESEFEAAKKRVLG